MSDLISRQAAIKAIEDLQDCYNGFSDTYDKACIIGVIEEVPPIDPTKQGLTNREYLATLSNEELSNTIYDVIVDGIGRRYNSSRLGVAQWLGELYRENDFTKGFAYYADNKKIRDEVEE